MFASLTVGFPLQALKLVSLSVASLTVGLSTQAFKAVKLLFATAPSQRMGLPFRDTVDWFPDIPPPHLKFRGTQWRPRECPRLTIARPVSLFVFGGPEGQDLGHLKKLVVVVGDKVDNSHSVFGVEAIFSDERPRVRLGLPKPFGCSNRVREFEFALDGAGGERIVSVKPYYQASHQTTVLCGFKVTGPI